MEARRLRDGVAAGAAGLKVWKTLGLRARDAAGRLVPVDDPRLDPLWATAGELGVPVDDPYRRSGGVLRAARRRRTNAGRSSRAHPDWHFWPTRPPDRPDLDGFPPFDELIDGLEARRGPPPGARRSSAPTSVAPPRTWARVSRDPRTLPELPRRHRRSARRARSPAVHGPGVLPALARSDPVRDGLRAGATYVRAPRAVPRDVRRVVRLRRRGAAVPGPLADPRPGSPGRGPRPRSTRGTPAGSSGSADPPSGSEVASLEEHERDQTEHERNGGQHEASPTARPFLIGLPSRYQ